MFNSINILRRHRSLHYITEPSRCLEGGSSASQIIRLLGAGTNDINRRVVA